MTFQIALLLACGLAVTLGSVMSHTSVYIPHQTRYSTRIEHEPRKPWPVKSSTQWIRSRSGPHKVTHESHKITRDSHKISQESHKISQDNHRMSHESHQISQDIGFGGESRVGPSALGVDAPTGYSYSSVSKHEKGGWSRVDVQIGSYHIPTSYSSFNLYSTK
ncbi:hypothetical protein GE061_019737 [Apolygus lucorum]|uniref:Attacin C-terminal domain-containing protein n=1 Tax=Apolygus lucorum TaxID=248454 RepID=A0A6A4JG13_APOLU|nr:hypothetical protein GE061_019737 [Apolygus lucorum]